MIRWPAAASSIEPISWPTWCPAPTTSRCYRAVLVIEQRRIEGTVWQRGPDGWDERRLTDPDATLDLSEFGLLCPVGAFYTGTHLRPRRRS